jgi:hypothetical protein
MKSIPLASEQINVQPFYNPIIDHVSLNTFQRKGGSLVKGQSFIVPIQEGTNASIVKFDSDLKENVPVLMHVSEITDTHVITETHGAFSKEICWSKA